MKMSIYQIEKDHLELVEQLIENGGELTEELESALALNNENLTTKGVNYGFVIKQLSGECSIIDAELARLTALKKSRQKAIEKLENALSVAMQVFGLEKIESPVMKISFRKSETVEITNLPLLPPEFLVSKTTVTPDKVKIKEAIKAGEEVLGARIEQHQNIQIK